METACLNLLLLERQRGVNLSRLLQIGINGNKSLQVLYATGANFPDYFKSELMETGALGITDPVPKAFPDYFKSELMETL